MRALLFLLLSAGVARADSCADPAPPRASRIELGLALENLMPSRLPGFDGTLPSYGVLLSLPWAGNSIEIGGLYGSADSFSAKIVHAGFRLNAETPHLAGYATVGAHFLSYSSPTLSAQSFFGGFAGLGVVLPMGKAFALDLGFKSYFQTRPLFAMGGAFRVGL